MKVILFGATGMVGSGVLIECLEDSRVQSVLVVGRRPCGATHPKVRDLIRSDFHNFADATAQLTGFDACFFCLGVSAAGKTEADYRHQTYDLTLAAARTIVGANPGLTFIYVSGQGTDSTEQGRMMWARVKGKTENDLLKLSPKAVMFRPGFIQPMKGVTSRFALYRAFYAVAGRLWPVLQRVFPTHVTTSVNVGRAMINVAANGYGKRVLDNPDINAVGG